MKRWGSMLAAAALMVALASIPLVADAKGPLGGQRAKAKTEPVPVGLFVSECRYSHRMADDPIVYPGRPGISHMHDFLGNDSTTAESTAQSLATYTSTTCHRADDLSAYWVPTLYWAGKAVKPLNASVYYLTGGKVPATIRSFPAGLKLIAGNSAATTRQDRQVVSWKCAHSREEKASPPLCRKRVLVLVIKFPDCWDGFDLDSVDHKSHLAYSVHMRSGARCPSSHSTPVPKLVLQVRYRTLGGPLVSLASGPAYTAHADFFNAWRQSALDALVQRCLNTNANCGAK